MLRAIEGKGKEGCNDALDRAFAILLTLEQGSHAFLDRTPGAAVSAASER